ncbi:DUF3822 family protein [Crocinitomix catalasitica]|uniref:DUF3822 family protein n=1 Tax=Crocinitomix catalasitica TaxID=184607 RepID=UPI00047F0C68|nr:DUF3822 family protein [Crocinitomix catalasitica]
MGFNTNDAYNHALCMDLSEEKFRYAIYHLPTKRIVEKQDFNLKEYSREEVVKHMDSPLFKASFTHFILSAGSNRNTLIPVDMFPYSTPKDIFKLNFSEPHENLDYNRIPELGIVNIYELPLWIKSQFVIKIPRVKIIHRSTVLLKGIFDQDTFYPKIHLWIEKNQFYLMMTDQSKLTYFNRFDYLEIADLIYHILFMLEQKEIDQTKIEMNVYGVSQDWLEENKLRQFFKFKLNLSDQNENGLDFILGKQFLCV